MESRAPSGKGPPSTSSIPDLFTSGASESIVGIRVYGTNAARSFPSGEWERLTVANDPGADLFINDPSVSRRGAHGVGHATIRRQAGSIIVADEGSKNGTYLDGERRSVFELRPGSVVTFGTVAMVAFSQRTEAMRTRLMRMLGFNEPYLANVEHAAYAALRRLHLIVHAPPGGIDRLTRIIHDIAPGAAWPRYVVDDEIRDDLTSQRAVLRRARLGTLVVPARFWPAGDAAPLRDALAAPTRELRLIFVADRFDPARPKPRKPVRAPEEYLGRQVRDLSVSIDVPTLAERGEMEIERTVHAGVQEFGVPLGVSRAVFSPAEMARLTGEPWASVEELDEITRRVTRVRLVGVPRAAELEAADATPIDLDSLRRWMRRNKFSLTLPS